MLVNNLHSQVNRVLEILNLKNPTQFSKVCQNLKFRTVECKVMESVHRSMAKEV